MRYLINDKKWIRYVSVLLLLMVLFTSIIFAGNGDGTGGGGGTEPVTLASSSPANGATNVSPNTSIHLEFTKNVVNLSVAENNRGCFKLTDNNGKAVGIQVLMGDDQLDTTVKKIIDIQPASSLQNGMKYTLTISGNLMGKNGYSMGNTVTMSFTTQGTGKATNDLEQPSQMKDVPGEAEKQSSGASIKEETSTGASVDLEKGKAKEINKEDKNQDSTNGLAIEIGIVIAIIILGYITFVSVRRNRKK